jgi:hypothetical protein
MAAPLAISNWLPCPETLIVVFFMRAIASVLKSKKLALPMKNRFL